jgi:hypothetical protein
VTDDVVKNAAASDTHRPLPAGAGVQGMIGAETIARGLSQDQQWIVSLGGVTWGNAPFHASLMRPLERRELFERVSERGFRTRWMLTPLGLEVRKILEGGAE